MPWNVARTSVCLCTFMFVAALASAQSRIAGVVTDESGAVLPGVAVEAASPVLIEKARTAVTDGQGRFDIANLRAGDYTVTFTLPGFNVVKREGLTVPDNFTATANAVLKLGTLDETVIVTGASPVVDVRQVQQTQVVPRDLLDALPTGRNFRSVGSLITAVRPQRQNLGDSNPWAQTIAVRGMGTNGTVILIDGLSTNSMQTGFAAYSNDAAIQEISYQTSANTADVSYGGLRANMVPRDGGNAMHGGGFFSFLEGRWQADNLTPELQARGLRVANRVVFTRDYNPWVSGPLMRDRVWFLGSFRRVPIHSQIGDAFFIDGRPQAHGRGWIQRGLHLLSREAAAGHRTRARHARVVCQRPPPGHRSQHGMEIDERQLALSTPETSDVRALVRDRLAQPEGGRRVGVGRIHADARGQCGSHADLPGGGAVLCRRRSDSVAFDNEAQGGSGRVRDG